MHDPEVKKLVDQLVSKRMSYSTIGKLLGVSKQRIHQIHRDYYPQQDIPRYCKYCDKTVEARVRVCSECKNKTTPGTIIPENNLPTKGYKYITKGLGKLEGRDFLKEQVRIRDNHTCQACLKVWEEGQRKFDVHHLDEELEGVNGLVYKNCKDLDRQITLCHKCHLNLDHIRKSMKKVKRG